MSKQPAAINALLQEALKQHRAGKLAAAAELYDRILSDLPDHPQALHLRSTVCLQQHQPEQALTMIERAMRAAGQAPELLLNRSTALLALDRPLAAARDAEVVASQHPQVFGAWFNLGLAELELERWEAASSSLARARQLRPDDVRCQIEWRLAELRRPGGSWVDLPDHLLTDASALVAELTALLTALVEREQLDQAAGLSHRISGQFKAMPDAELNWIRAVKRSGLTVTASRLAEDLLQRHPRHSEARLLLATELQTRGLAQAACEQYEALLDHDPGYWQAHSNYLIALQLNPASSAEQLVQAHQHWARQHAPAAESVARRTAPEIVRIGWFTPRLLAGPMSTFFAAILEAFPRVGVEHWLYQCHSASDQTTPRFIRAADRYIDVAEMDDEQLVDQARRDALDLAMDLSGHAPHHRLRAFARRMAPVQLSWLDYFHPTGIPALDGFISDRVLEQDEAGGESAALLLSRGRLCYAPPSGAPAPEARAEGATQLACFSRIAKINDQVLQAWAKILARLPGAELSLRCHQLDQAETRYEFLQRAARAGISRDRLKLNGWTDHLRVLEAYNGVDLALDTFPYSGCATSADALYMGVPVVTLTGSTRVSRQTASLLEHAGLHSWIAGNVDDYVERAVQLAEQGHHNSEHRLTIRQKFMQQVGDSAAFAAELERLLKTAALDFDEKSPI